MDFDRHSLTAILWAERPETENAPRHQLRLCRDTLRTLPVTYSLTPSQVRRLAFAIRRINRLITINRLTQARTPGLRGRRRPGPLDRPFDL